MEKVVCGLAIALGVGLRVFRFWEPSLWLDEIATAHAALAPDLATLLERCRLGFEPPLHHLVARLFLALDRSELFLRLPALLCGLGSMALLMGCVRRVGGTRGALYAGAIFALNSRGVLHSQDGRMYALAMLLTLASIYTMARVLEGAGRRWLGAYVVATALLSYAHLLYTSVLGVEAVVAAGLWWRGERSRNLKTLAGGQVTVLALLAPLAPLVADVFRFRSMYGGWTAAPGAEWLLDWFQWPEVALAGVLAPGLALLWPRRRELMGENGAGNPLFWWGALAAAMWPAVVALAGLGIVNVLQPRYLLPSLLGLLVTLGITVGRVNEPFLRVGLCAYLFLVGGFHVLVAARMGPWVGILPNQDWRAASRWVEAHYRPGDLVLLRSGWTTVSNLGPTSPAKEFLSAPLTGFYNRRPLPVSNLPWKAAQLFDSPHTPAEVRRQAQQAEQVFVLVNPQRDGWDWEVMEQWLQGPGGAASEVERRRFLGLQLRVYRKAAGLNAGIPALRP